MAPILAEHYYKNGAFLTLLSNLAGDESLNWHRLVEDFILVGRKLEELGFIYSQDKVIAIEDSLQYI